MPVATKSYRDLLGEAQHLFEEAKSIVASGEPTQEDLAKVGKMVEEAKALQNRANLLKELEESKELIIPQIEEKNVPEGGRAIPPSQFKRWGEFLFKTWENQHPNFRGQRDPRLSFFSDDEPKSHDKKDMSGATGAGGGFLIPAEFQAQLMALTAERAIVRPRATVIPMRRRQLDIPVVDQTDTGTTTDDPHMFGGLHFYWAEEASAKTESDAKFRQISLVAHKLIGYTRASDELLDDSAIGLEAFFQGPLGFAGGVAWMEDYAFLRGTGAGQPLGVINAGATIVHPRNVVNQVNLVDIINLVAHFLPGGRGLWVASQSVLPSIYQLNGPAANASYVWIPNARDGAPGTLFGYPLVFSEKPPLLGQQGDIGLYDFAYYLVGDRQATTVESTKFDRWQYDQTSWRVVHRVDGQPWLSTWYTANDGSTTVSPFVILGLGSGS